MTHREMAEANFKEGYNCSQAVFAAFSEEVGLPRQTALQLASGFGGGVGRMREVCGAFSGAVMALGALYGSDDPAHKTAVYATSGTTEVSAEMPSACFQLDLNASLKSENRNAC